MKLIGLSGPAGAGKDTIADYLVAKHDFTKFSFSDPLYAECAAAFRIDKALLYVRETKEQPMSALAPINCTDPTFVEVMRADGIGQTQPVSPRRALQLWGTEYRRNQDPLYWITKAGLFVEAWWQRIQHDHPGRQHGGLVNCSVRFPNERAFIEHYNGEIWHVRRGDWAKGMGAHEAKHEAETGLPNLAHDKEVHNNGTIEQLHTAAVLLLGAQGGTTIKIVPEAANEYVACAKCGTTHLVMTKEQAQSEIDIYNANREAIIAQTKQPLPVANIADYLVCSACDHPLMRPLGSGDSRKGADERPVVLS
jgi:hypothetical protein